MDPSLDDLILMCELAGLKAQIQTSVWGTKLYVRIKKPKGGYTYVNGTEQADWAEAILRLTTGLTRKK